MKFFFECVYFRAAKPNGCFLIYIEKIAKNHLWEDMTVLGGRGHLSTKVNITYVVGNEVLNIFHFTVFLTKIIFCKMTAKKNFGLGGMASFQGKMTITSSTKNGVSNMILKFFSQKSPYRLNESRKAIFAGTFPQYSGSIRPIVSKK